MCCHFGLCSKWKTFLPFKAWRDKATENKRHFLWYEKYFVGGVAMMIDNHLWSNTSTAVSAVPYLLNNLTLYK